MLFKEVFVQEEKVISGDIYLFNIIKVHVEIDHVN